MACEPFAGLGEYLTAGEAEGLASLLEAGEHIVHALSCVSPARREHAAELLKRAGLGHEQPELSVAVLRAIAGAKSVHRELIPVWTMPGNEATVGHLTSEFHSMVTGAGSPSPARPTTSPTARTCGAPCGPRRSNPG